MVFSENEKQNKSCTFTDILLQPYKSYFVLATIKYFESHEAISHWKLIKKSEVNNKHKNKYGKLKTILSIWYFKRKRFPYRNLMKHNVILCAHGVMQQWGVN